MLVIVNLIPIALHIRMPFNFESELLDHVQIDSLKMPGSLLFMPMLIALVLLVFVLQNAVNARTLKYITDFRS